MTAESIAALPIRMQRRPTALIMDFGGVLTTNLFDVFREFARSQGLPTELLVELSTTHPDGTRLWHALERGELDQPEFDRALGALLGVDGNRLLQRLAEMLRPDEQMLAQVDVLRRRGVKTAVLSNSWGSGYVDPYRPWELDRRVDVVVLSDQVRMRKPEPGIFQLAMDRLGVPAAQCVFVDDIAAYLETPAELGIATIHHTDPAATVRQLSELFGVPTGDQLDGS